MLLQDFEGKPTAKISQMHDYADMEEIGRSEAEIS